MMIMMVMMMMTVQAVFFLIPHVLKLFASWVVALTGQCKTLLSCVSNAARLVAAEHQDEAQASASRCVRRIPSAEAAANE